MAILGNWLPKSVFQRHFGIRERAQITLRNNRTKCAVAWLMMSRSLRVFHRDVAVEPATGGPLAFDPDFARLYDSDEVVQNPIGDLFVENAFISEGLQVHFEALQLDANFLGNIREHDRSVVRLPGFGAHRGELGAIVLDREIALLGGILEYFENFTEAVGGSAVDGGHGVLFTNQMGQSFWSIRVLLYLSRKGR